MTVLNRLRARWRSLEGNVEQVVGLRAVATPLDTLPRDTRARLRECAQELDVPEEVALVLAVRALALKLRADEQPQDY